MARPNAVLALTTNLVGHMEELYVVFETVLRSAGDEQALNRLRDHIAHRATIPAVSALLEANRFRVTKVIERAAVMRFADGTALLNHHFIKLGFLEGWKEVAGADQGHTFRALCNALDRHARAAGELRLSIPMAYVEAIAQ